ncbi:MAG: helix-turn-helix domain-containing protein [Gemmataceae bacterium]
MRNGQRNKRGTTKAALSKPIPVEQGSGNVFADLGLPHSDLALAKAELVQRIRDLIAKRRLTQVEAAKLLGLDQPKVSSLVRGRVAGYSIDRLFRFLNALGQRVEITIRPSDAQARECEVVVT